MDTPVCDALAAPPLPQSLQHSVQVRGRRLHVEILVLAGTRLGGQDATSMDVLEIAVRKLVPCLRVLCFLVVLTELPLPVLVEPVLLDELVLPPRGGLMLAPVVTLIKHILLILDEPLRMLVRPVVRPECHN